ncbi:zinc finger domain-containing protein [Catenuloplanes japonicus]|uniref:zinc finger domain-containing protein n=1 Tax=Catenuloplanes japonicus TaxID=33876 RepID=UPI000526BE61|nr:hypothetical protein [Catenuloplanes japonicus]
MTIAPERPSAAFLLYRRVAAAALAPITETCKTCNARPGIHCRSRTGYQVQFHKPRRDAVAHLNEDERAAAVETLQAGQAKRRADAEQARAELAADPARSAAQAASHARIQAAWDATAVAL